MALEREDILDLVQLAERQLKRLKMLCGEAALQRELLRCMLERLESIERSQYS